MEKPILFSTDMVQALLDGRKTQTRRTVKIFSSDENELRQNAMWLFQNKTCPYGNPGDLLWVREAFYKRTDGRIQYRQQLELQGWDFKWKPSIYMPKDAARIWLKVTNVRVERLQDISEDDAIAEGIQKVGEYWKFYIKKQPNMWKPAVDSPIISFMCLWESINGDRSWLVNPWVWVVEFEVVSTTGRANVKEVQA